MFGALLSTLVELVHRTMWTFARYGIVLRHTWLGIGPRWTWEVQSLDRMELRREEESKRRWFLPGNQPCAADGGGEGPGYRLSLVDRENAELCSIDGLTEGEARWIGDTVLRERAGWFR